MCHQARSSGSALTPRAAPRACGCRASGRGPRAGAIAAPRACHARVRQGRVALSAPCGVHDRPAASQCQRSAGGRRRSDQRAAGPAGSTSAIVGRTCCRSSASDEVRARHAAAPGEAQRALDRAAARARRRLRSPVGRPGRRLHRAHRRGHRLLLGDGHHPVRRRPRAPPAAGRDEHPRLRGGRQLPAPDRRRGQRPGDRRRVRAGAALRPAHRRALGHLRLPGAAAGHPSELCGGAGRAAGDDRAGALPHRPPGQGRGGPASSASSARSPAATSSPAGSSSPARRRSAAPGGARDQAPHPAGAPPPVGLPVRGRAARSSAGRCSARTPQPEEDGEAA